MKGADAKAEFKPQTTGLQVMLNNHSVKGKSHWPGGQGRAHNYSAIQLHPALC